jgi:Zn-dependent peptidase ImmA (M78 family)
LSVEERARQAAESARYRLGIPPGRVEVIGAIKQLGIRLLRYPVDDGLEGAYLRTEGCSYILVNSSARPVRQRFTAAHELGHHFLHPDVDLAHYDQDLYTPEDRVANLFAAHLLMDADTVHQLAEPETDPLRRALLIRDEFDVSLEAAAIHLCNLGLMAEADRMAVMEARDRSSIPQLARRVGLDAPPDPRPDNAIDPGAEYVAALTEVRDAGFLSDERYRAMVEPFSRTQRRRVAASPAQ